MADITYICSGNIFSSKCNAIVNPVNCVGVAGAGLAKQFKNRYPHMFWEYKTDCEKGLYTPGMIVVYRAYPEHYSLGNPKYIINFSTKGHWKDKSKLSYIQGGMTHLEEYLYGDWNAHNFEESIKSVALPALGCGLGGLNKKDVFPIMEKCLELLDIRVEIYN